MGVNPVNLFDRDIGLVRYSNPKSIERMFVTCSLLPAPCSLLPVPRSAVPFAISAITLGIS
ncbi:hypothetical protein [Moorena producens]|uniref:hypothetical protein n=1 Tax=Moorena producens TaxID=1155739 RepID=UPI0013140EB5|nr:hypothetical protein [Moorena producens]